MEVGSHTTQVLRKNCPRPLCICEGGAAQGLSYMSDFYAIFQFDRDRLDKSIRRFDRETLNGPPGKALKQCYHQRMGAVYADFLSSKGAVSIPRLFIISASVFLSTDFE